MGQTHSLLTYTHSRAASLRCQLWSHAFLQAVEESQHGWGAHLMAEGAREPGLELRFPGVTWCHQIQESGSSFSAAQTLPVPVFTLWVTAGSSSRASVHWTQPGDLGAGFSPAANLLCAPGMLFSSPVYSPLIILIFIEFTCILTICWCCGLNVCIPPKLLC